MAAVSTKCGVGSSRVTHYINRKPASHLHHAVRLAETIGRPLTHLVTINFAHTRCEPEKVSACFETLRNDRFSPWVKRPPRGSASTACPPTYVWVIENKGGMAHAHWLVHLPAGRVAAFKDRLPKWLMAVTGAIIAPEAIDVRSIDNAVGAKRYVLKGIDPAWAHFYRVKHDPQGEVHGKRAGYSRNIGPTAKQRLREEGRYRPAWRGSKTVLRHPPASASVGQ